MPENRIFARNREGKKAQVMQLIWPSTELVELAAIAGFDGVDIDGEHGAFSPLDIDLVCRTAQGFGMTVTARVPSVDPVAINVYLARGVQGIQGPHIETAEQAQLLADSCMFPPDGERSWGPGRGTEYGHEPNIKNLHGGNVEYMRDANANIYIYGQIESRKGVENLDEILKVKHLHAIAYGANDMASSLGHPGEPNHPDVKAAHADIEKRVRAAGKHLMTDRFTPLRVSTFLLDKLMDYTKQHANDAATVDGA
ncbi:MAG: aldolase/citrate lyase family protein [Dehalococcoidia bacterium]